MTATNDAIKFHLGMKQHNLDDDVTAGAASAQAGATAILGSSTRVTKSGANGSLILRSTLTLDAPPTCWVMNESGQTVKVFASVGENLNGALNASLSVADGQGAVFVRLRTTQDWRSAVIP